MTLTVTLFHTSITVIFLCLSPALAAVQSFSQEPGDETVTGGEELVLRCRVKNIQGNCQWTKDGFGLGNSRDLPGFPRYRMTEGGGGTATSGSAPSCPVTRPPTSARWGPARDSPPSSPGQRW